jgi:hypothetical protein
MNPRHVPVGAATLEVLSGIVTKADAWTFGRKVTLTHKVFYGSDGYKSKYQSHRIEYLILAIEGEKTRAFRYSGKNLHGAIDVIATMRPWLKAGAL